MKAIDSSDPWKVNKKEKIYENPWITLYHHDVITPGGNNGVYGMVDFKNLAIGVIPLDKENNTWLVGQYRFPNEEYSWEIPAGGGALNELPVKAAKRELIEECGIIAKKWEHLLEMRLSNSVSNEIAHIYMARDLSFTSSQPEDTEQLEIKKVPFKKALELVMDGTIKDSMSVAGLLKVNALLT